MAYGPDKKMVVGVSSRTLFDLTIENEIFETQGLDAYCKYQTEHEKDILKPGPGFQLVKGLLQLNERREGPELVEVIIMSHNSPNTALRIFNSVAHYNLAISRCWSAGHPWRLIWRRSILTCSCRHARRMYSVP